MCVFLHFSVDIIILFCLLLLLLKMPIGGWWCSGVCRFRIIELDFYSEIRKIAQKYLKFNKSIIHDKFYIQIGLSLAGQ